ncbi:MAG: GxxExxY protein [Burkholderiales bacterium]|nr:GxxExxY protein [Burkholderiales bacterium]
MRPLWPSSSSSPGCDTSARNRFRFVIPVRYRDHAIGEFRLDLLVEDAVVIEVKSVERMDPLFDAQLLSYLKLGGYRLGLLLNFRSALLKQGIKRLANDFPLE